MKSNCIAAYTLQTLITTLNNADDNYTNVNNGYDELFSYYVTYMENLVPTILHTELILDGDGDTSGNGDTPTLADGASCKRLPMIPDPSQSSSAKRTVN